MTLKRMVALELLAAHRALAGHHTPTGFAAFTYSPDVTERIVENILQLTRAADEADKFRVELAKQLGLDITAKSVLASPQTARFDAGWQNWLQGDCEVELKPFEKADLNFAENNVPVYARLALLVVMKS